jgi:antitoxin component YwqK of YwqJK toxin-antitoxin module
MRFLVLLIGLVSMLVSCEGEALVVDKLSTDFTLVNGVLYYQNNPFEGLLVSTYTDGSFKMKLQYVEGRKDGYEKQWHPNGELSQSRWYSQGIKVNNHLGWWQDGTPKFEYHFNIKGEYEGSRKEWYQNGQLVRDFNYTSGKEIGSQRMWTDSGKIRANYEVRNGERFGLIGLKKCYTVKTDSNELQ